MSVDEAKWIGNSIRQKRQFLIILIILDKPILTKRLQQKKVVPALASMSSPFLLLLMLLMLLLLVLPMLMLLLMLLLKCLIKEVFIYLLDFQKIIKFKTRFWECNKRKSDWSVMAACLDVCWTLEAGNKENKTNMAFCLVTVSGSSLI